ncbi:MAG: hypothetical protein ACJ73E_00860 [Mycobacteriales bacterium]
MNRPVRRAALALAAVVLAACGTHSPQRPAPAPGGAAGLTAVQVAQALLTVTDLPLGFQAQDGAPDATALGCAGVDQVYLPAGTAARAAVSFGHSLSAAFVNETISSRPGGGAATALAGFARAGRDCAFFSGPDGTAYQVTALELPTYGDGSAAVRVSSTLREARPVDLVAVRVGDTLLAVATAGAGEQETRLTRTVVDRALAKLARST